MAWRTARSVTVLHEQLARGAPRAVPPATDPDAWGTIGDVLHDTTSDHVPHNFPGWADQVVTAGDFPNAPALGLDAHKVLDDIRRSKDARAKYGISNDQIFSNHAVTQDGVSYPAWTWRPYLPHDPNRDRHRTHGHLSVVGDARADGTQPWQTIGAPAAAGEDDDDMGASFGPIEIRPYHPDFPTSLSIPPVQAGIADPRPAWLNITNDTNGKTVAYRLAIGDGKGWPVIETFTLGSGARYSKPLPKGAVVLSIGRMGLDASGKPVQPELDGRPNPAMVTPPYAGHLTCCIERGPVGSTG